MKKLFLALALTLAAGSAFAAKPEIPCNKCNFVPETPVETTAKPERPVETTAKPERPVETTADGDMNAQLKCYPDCYRLAPIFTGTRTN